MNRLKRISSLVLAVLMFVTLNSFSLMAYAAEQGTESNPYQITTAQELQNINNNVSAHYKLMADIDLKNMDFTPIGNADSGTFSGSFDGNGYTISNLNVFSGKYAGLFGCNEGIIKNVILKDIYVYGTRYIGGVVGQNTSIGLVADCTVQSGKIESDGGVNNVNAGGICGSNEGSIEGELSNGADLNIAIKDVIKKDDYDYGDAYVGGIFGWNNKNFRLIASNTGNVFSFSDAVYTRLCCGGIIGYSYSNVTITNNYNAGNIFSSTNKVYNFPYLGGIIGYGYSNITITNSCNTGNVSSTTNGCYATPFSGGMIGCANSTLTITNSYNTGIISSNGYNEYHWNSKSYSDSGGLIAYANSNVTILNSYNGGNIISSAYNFARSGGMIAYAGSIVSIKNSYNTGNVFSSSCSSNSGGLIGFSGSTLEITSSYTSNSIQKNAYDINRIRNSSQLQSQDIYVGWDFNEVWAIDQTINNGYPVLKTVQSPLQLNKSNANIETGKTYNLIAYKNGKIADDIVWSVTDGNSTVNSQGIVVAGTGMSTITATDSEGNKANCNIYAFTPASSITITDKTINISDSSISNDYSIIGGSGDYIVNFKSSDESVAEVNYDGTLTPKSVGTATITATTMGGAVGTQKITIVNSAQSISLPSSMTLGRGATRQLTATTNPSPTSSKITWTSSNNNVATVDQNGNVTGVSIGSATITAETDNGYSATCSVNVNAPVTSIEFVQPSVSVYKGYTVQLDVVTDPSDTTDAITYSSSSTAIATVSTSGVVTAKATGTATITATSASGKKAYCAITVLAAPVVVTDLTLGVDRKDMLIGELYTLSATITPSTATDKTIIWKTTNSDIVDVSETGVLTAKGAGKAIVSATTSSGITKYCVVNVAGVSDGAIARIFVPDISQTGVDYIDVPVIIENNPGISFASISVGYDANELEPIDVTNGTVFDSVTGSFDTDNNVVKLYFTSEENKTADGNLAIIRFRVINTGAVETRVSVAYMPGGITNNAEEAVAFNLADGRVETELCIHENTEVRNAKTATCTEQGYTGDIYCLDCGDLLETGTALDITPHHYQTTVFEPTENKQGYTKYVCTDCGYSYVGDITDYASDNSVLIAILETIASYSEENYSADSFANLQAIYNNYSSMATGSYAQIEIDNAAFDLITAVSALEPYLNLNTSASNGTFTVTYNDETNSNFNNSLLFGTNVTLTATANEGYEFVGWYDTINNLYFSKNAEYSFKLTTNTSLKAVFVNEQSATLTFTTYSNWVQSTVTKTIDEWNDVTSIDDLLPEVPYKYGYSNGRWVYDNADVLAKLQTGENVSLIPEYDEDDTSLPTPPSPKGDTPVLDLYYKLDSEANVGSFVMAAGIPENCQLESVGILFYYKNADEFDPTKFELFINNKMLAGRFNTDEIEDIYIVNMNKMSADKNWATRGYVTYYDSDGNLKTVYSNQINIVNREQV